MHNEKNISVISEEIFMNFHQEPIRIPLKKLTCSILLQFTFVHTRMKFSFQNLLKNWGKINSDTNQEQDETKKSGVSSQTVMWGELFVKGRVMVAMISYENNSISSSYN